MSAFSSAVCQPTVASFAGVGLFAGNFLAVKAQHLIENFLSPSPGFFTGSGEFWGLKPALCVSRVKPMKLRSGSPAPVFIDGETEAYLENLIIYSKAGGSALYICPMPFWCPAKYLGQRRLHE